ncbi:hypothetical protein I1A62_29950 [Rhodococcus sp. USK10]|uniref:3'-5' exonuclease n=1 Tax=Rhodococcus sp. USK10 TaxID=2789739 RepID=UPI001C5DA06F|nr:exonuclease domain-containing protein [Rhodococcus sp. USK10]QYB01458.1 hypothetical protein I1A62_29950 [Rhodococcus sp. USK10]
MIPASNAQAAPLVFVDTETTGLHPDTRRPWEIALIRRDDQGDTEYLFQVTDVDLSHADPKSLEIGRFHDRHVRDVRPHFHKVVDAATALAQAGLPNRVIVGGPSPDDPTNPLPESAVAARVDEITAGAHIVAVNPAFDAAVLDAMLRRNRLIPRWDYHLIDARAMAIGWLHAKIGSVVLRKTQKPLYQWRSDDLSYACNVHTPDENERHTALGDARWAMRWYDHLAAGVRTPDPVES